MAELIFRVRPDYPGDVRLLFEMAPFVPTRVGHLTVTVSVNGLASAFWRFRKSGKNYKRLLNCGSVPDDGLIIIRLEMEPNFSPAELGEGVDPRRLGIGLLSIEAVPRFPVTRFFKRIFSTFSKRQ